MCTVIPKSKKGHPSIAKEDIEVYKTCDKIDKTSVSSCYQKFLYRKDKLYSITKFSYDNDRCCSDTIEHDYRDTLDNPVYVNKGFHSFDKNDNRLKDHFELPCRFIIPKGSRYYKNSVGNIVSNQIIFKEIL